jgi:hypothetical protein
MQIYIVDQENNKISPAFIKANRYILQIYHKDLTILSECQKIQVLERLWKKEFDAELIKSKDGKFWNLIRFNSEIEKTLFLLKWG